MGQVRESREGALTLLSPPSDTGVNSSHLHRQLLRVRTRTVVPDPSSHRGPGTQEGLSCRVLAQCWLSLPAVRPDERDALHMWGHTARRKSLRQAGWAASRARSVRVSA